MKKNFPLIFCFFISIIANAQSGSPYYYYHGEKITLTESLDTVLVYFDNRIVSDSIVERNYNLVKKIQLTDGESDSLTAYVIRYDSDIHTIKDQSGVWNVEPCFNGVPISNRFYIKIGTTNDITDIQRIANDIDISFNGAMPECNNWYELSTNRYTSINTLEACNIFWESGLCDEVCPGFIHEMLSSGISNGDGILNSLQWGLDAISASDAWEITTGDSSIKVAIVAFGVDELHQEFVGTNISESYNITMGTSGAYLNGVDATRIGGIIFANHNYAQIDGIAPDASMMNISITNEAASVYLLNQMSQAINHSAANHANVIIADLSMLYPLTYTLLEDAISNAIDTGCTIILPAGDYTDGILCNVRYPARVNSDFIVVGAINDVLGRCNTSCYGSELDVMAPGEDIYSSSFSQFNYTSLYDTYTATNLAAAHVSGIAALMLSANSNLSSEQVSRIIKGTAQKVGGYTYQYSSDHLNGTWNEEMGHGLVDAYAAVSAAVATHAYDLYIRDNSADDGTEPNYTTASVTASPDIKIYDLNGNEMSTLTSGETYNICVTVHSKGTATCFFDISNLVVHWTFSTGTLLWQSSWTNAGSLCGVAKSGTMTTSSTRPRIVLPGHSTTVSFQWTAPTFNSSTCMSIVPGTMTLTLLAEVIDGGLTIGKTATDYPLDHYVRTNNNVARRSFSMWTSLTHGQLTINPNPATDQTVVRCELSADVAEATVVISSLTGRVVNTFSVTPTSVPVTVSLQSLPAGQYLVRLICDDDVLDVKQLIVE